MSAAAGLLALALLAQILLTLGVYLVMSVRRQQAMRRGDARPEDYVLVQNEPRYAARATRNLANQFELPVLFYALGLMLLALGGATLIDVALAWIFVASRFAHAAVALSSENVKLRGLVFLVGLVAVGLLVLHVAMVVIASIS